MRKLRDLYFVIGLFLTVNCATAAENSPFAFKAGDPDDFNSLSREESDT